MDRGRHRLRRHVLVVGNEQARGAASGAAISSRNYVVLTLRGGKLLRYREFYDEAAAREAAAGDSRP
jgi:ketosteroid isomerase-like protein